MELEQLPNGRYTQVELVVTGSLKWAKLGDKWYALNYRSADPVTMRNRDLRGAFARAVGIPVKEVESFVRREKNRIKRENMTKELRDARALLQAHGYNVLIDMTRGQRER